MPATLDPRFSLVEKAATLSTNDDARALAQDGAAHLTVVRADEQGAGRGRGGRAWSSPPGNVYSSILLRPQPSWPTVLNLPFVTALAIVDAARGFLGGSDAQVRTKWPNDVLIDGAKVSGVLLEAGPAIRNGGFEWIIIGAGINVGFAPALPDRPAAALADLCTPPPSVDAVFTAYCNAFAAGLDQWLAEGFQPVRARFVAHSVGIGAPITVRAGPGGGAIAGRMRDIDGAGALLLELSDGTVKTLTTGDVFLGEAGG